MKKNTMYKQFLADAAKDFMKEMISQEIANGKIDLNKSAKENEVAYQNIAIQASHAATIIAEELSHNWSPVYDGTTFFDTSDTPYTKMEDAICNLSENIEKLIKN